MDINLPSSIYSERELDREGDPGGLSSCILSSASWDETHRFPPSHHHLLASEAEHYGPNNKVE